jgi:hypothetical protein
MRDRSILILSTTTLQPLYPPLLRRDTGTGQPHAVLWFDAHHLLVPSDNGLYRALHKRQSGAVSAVMSGAARATALAWAKAPERLWVLRMGEILSVSCVGKWKAPPPQSIVPPPSVFASASASDADTEPALSISAFTASSDSKRASASPAASQVDPEPAISISAFTASSDTKSAPTSTSTSAATSASAASAPSNPILALSATQSSALQALSESESKISGESGHSSRWLELSASYELAFNAVGCTNVALSGDGLWCAAGDLSGNVLIWGVKHSPSQPAFSAK